VCPQIIATSFDFHDRYEKRHYHPGTDANLLNLFCNDMQNIQSHGCAVRDWNTMSQPNNGELGMFLTLGAPPRNPSGNSNIITITTVELQNTLW
jgi:hypothetical protein